MNAHGTRTIRDQMVSPQLLLALLAENEGVMEVINPAALLIGEIYHLLFPDKNIPADTRTSREYLRAHLPKAITSLALCRSDLDQSVAKTTKYYHDFAMWKFVFIDKVHYRRSKKYIWNAKRILERIQANIPRLTNRLRRLLEMSQWDQGLLKKVHNTLAKNRDQMANAQGFLSYPYGRIELEQNFCRELKELYELVIPQRQLETGDVLLSLKSKIFLRDPAQQLSKIIAALSQSHVTHAAMVLDEDGHIQMIEANERSGATEVFLRDIEAESNTILLVFRRGRGLDPGEKNKLLQYSRKAAQLRVPYSKPKAGGAMVAGVFERVINTFHRGYIHVPNLAESLLKRGLIKRPREVFCSEFVNDAYLQINIHLTMKLSSASVYPADLLSTGQLNFIGFTSQSEDYTRRYLADIFAKYGTRA